MCRAMGSKPARKCWRDLIRTYFLRRGSMPQWVKTPVSNGSLRPSDTTIWTPPVSSTAVPPAPPPGPPARAPAGVEHRGPAHPHPGPGGHRTGDGELAVSDARDLAGDGER